MNFQKTLISGEFIKRYKRFFVDVKIGNNIITAHCPNTGSMMGLLNKGNKVWLSRSDNPKRKLRYTLQIIEDKKSDTEIVEMAEKDLIHLKIKKQDYENKLKIFLLPKDEDDDKNAIVEIRAVTGELEASLLSLIHIS